MRKRYRVLVFAAMVAALVVPVGFALELPMAAPSASIAGSPTYLLVIPDAMKLVAVGASLIGLAAFVRKAV